jgi:lipid-binding SYLF domain-containing protein
MKKRVGFLILFSVLLIIFIHITVSAQQLTREEDRIIESLDVFQQIVERENQTEVISELLQHAQGIAIFPKLTKIGLGVGVQFGEGIVLRKDQETQQWFGPAFIEIKTASVGPQIGIQDVSLVLIIMDKTGIEGFKKTDYEIGANISISPGPTKESLQKGVDFNDSIYTYSFSEGLYAGFTLEGSVIHADRSANQSFYGTEINNEDILNTQEPNNESVLKLIIAIEQISK